MVQTHGYLKKLKKQIKDNLYLYLTDFSKILKYL